MELSEALAFLEQNHVAIVSTVSPKGRAQATVVGACLYEGKVAFISRGETVKVSNALKRGRATITVLRPADTRYVTVEGPAEVYGWKNTERAKLLDLLGKVYAASGRAPETWKDFGAAMEEEQRTVVLVSIDRFYGSLVRGH
ncbi:MAG TPA: TIGR03618 family F420-dependent PPOX class oxidoreductase [Chloroflexota bacterium]